MMELSTVAMQDDECPFDRNHVVSKAPNKTQQELLTDGEGVPVKQLCNDGVLQRPDELQEALPGGCAPQHDALQPEKRLHSKHAPVIHVSNLLRDSGVSCAPYLWAEETHDIVSSLGACPKTEHVASSNHHTARGRKRHLYPGGPLCVGSQLPLDAVQLLLQLPL